MQVRCRFGRAALATGVLHTVGTESIAINAHAHSSTADSCRSHELAEHRIVNAAGLWSSKRATSTRASGLLTMVLDVFTTWCYDVDRLVLAVQVVVIGFARVM